MKASNSAVAAALLAILLSIPMAGKSGEVGGRVSIVALRPYVGLAYVQVSPGGLCGTEMFTIKVDEPGGKEMYALALTAITSGKKVELEVSNATGCTGWGTRLQSMFIYP